MEIKIRKKIYTSFMVVVELRNLARVGEIHIFSFLSEALKTSTLKNNFDILFLSAKQRNDIALLGV